MMNDGDDETENEWLIREYRFVKEFSKCMAMAEEIEKSIPASRPMWSTNDLIVRLAIAERFISKFGADSEYEDFKADMHHARGEITKHNPQLVSISEKDMNNLMDAVDHYLDEQAHGKKGKES